MNEAFCQNKELLLRHLRFVLEYNKKVNLTSIDNLDAGILLHIEDSLSALPEVLQAPEGKMADIGSGGGFPGIPLAIASGRQTMLIESISKKATALREFVQAEGLQAQISVTDQRSEEVAIHLPARFSVITARAVSELPVLVELAAPLLQQGGMLIALKGVPSENEVSRGVKAGSIVGLEPNSTRAFLLGDSVTRRTIITYTKISSPKITLPRRAGQATKRPLA